MLDVVLKDVMDRFYHFFLYLNKWAVYNFCRGDRVWLMPGRMSHIYASWPILAVIQQPRVACREDGSYWSNLQPTVAPPYNAPGLHLCEMALEVLPRQVTDVFSLRSTMLFQDSTSFLHCVIERNVEKWRHTPFIDPPIACREDGSDWWNLELAPPYNVPGSHFREMAFVSVTPDDIDVFSLRPTLPSPRFDVLSALRVACREVSPASALFLRLRLLLLLLFIYFIFIQL